MKSFFKTLFATFLALVLFSIVAVLLGIGVFMGFYKLISKQEPIANGSFLVVDMSVNLTDAPVIFGGAKGLGQLLGRNETDTVSLRALLDAIHEAAGDDRISGIFLHGSFTPESYGAGFAALKEVREALLDFRKSKKPVIAYLVGPSTRDYYLASAAETVYLNPYGEMELPGLASTPTFFKGALDKYGVGVQVVRHGKYKSAVEPFLTDKMSPENREQTQKLLDDVWGQFLTDVGTARNKTPAEIQAVVDAKGIITSEDAKAAGLIDEVAYLPDVIEKLRAKAGTDDKIHSFRQVDIASYVEKKLSKVENADDTVAATTGLTDKSPRLAIVYAEGEIVDGDSDKTGVVSGERYARVLRRLRQDANVKAILLRVNSPGGSGLASEIIQHELALARAAGKTVVVSMGTVAASGGYWISTAADQVFAEPNTITGSIGVFGILPNFQGLANDHGVTFDEVKTGKYAALTTATRPKTPEEFAAMQALVEDFYKKFVNKVADGRKLPADKVDEIGQGRVWSGGEALKLGLVDKIGGLNDAMNFAREKGGLPNDAKIVEFPVPGVSEQLLAALGNKKDPATSAGTAMLRELGIGPRSGTLGRSLNDVQSDLRTLNEVNSQTSVYARLPFDLRVH